MGRLRSKRLRWLLQVGGVELAQIPRYALLDLSEPALHLRACKILVAVVDRFELAAVNRHARCRQQAKLSAKGDKLRAHLAYRRTVILAEIGNRLVIGSQPTGEPHRLNIASSLPLKPPARLNPVEVAVNVELQQYRWMVGRPSGCLRLDPAKPKLRQIEFLDKDVDRSNGIVLADPVFQAFGKQRALPAIRALTEAPHPILPRITSRDSHQTRRFHTARVKIGLAVMSAA